MIDWEASLGAKRYFGVLRLLVEKNGEEDLLGSKWLIDQPFGISYLVFKHPLVLLAHCDDRRMVLRIEGEIIIQQVGGEAYLIY